MAIVAAILDAYPEWFDSFSEDAEERGIGLPEEMTAEGVDVMIEVVRESLGKSPRSTVYR